jgi:hypothetical protein
MVSGTSFWKIHDYFASKRVISIFYLSIKGNPVNLHKLLKETTRRKCWKAAGDI